ncbi:MAG: hypothetical protein LBP22_02720 [Deltaproteobacteria bacterium]|jgi:hypothetical protein|nr:hypothetical protein [Deltaproteobacteria bacterium]
MKNHYQASGRFETGGLFWLVISSAVFSSLLAVPYALCLWYCPIVYLGALLPIIYVKLTALFCSWAVRKGKIRSTQLANALGFFGSIPGFYFSWVVWAVLVDNVSGQGSFNLGWRAVPVLESSLSLGQVISQALDPGSLIKAVTHIASGGLWTVEGTTVSGGLLYVVWLLEALIYFFFSARSYGKYALKPFSEQLNRWLPKISLPTPLALSAKTPTEEVFNGLRAGQLGPILEAKPEKNPLDNSYIKLVIYYEQGAGEVYADVTGYALKDSGSHSRYFLGRYVKIPEILGKTLIDKLS